MPKNDGTPGEHLLNLPHQLYCVFFVLYFGHVLGPHVLGGK